MSARRGCALHSAREDRARPGRTVVERAGRAAEDFVLFRAVVPYPPMPCSVVFRYPLPRKP